MKKMVYRYAIDNKQDVVKVESEGIRRTKDHQLVTLSLSKSFAVTADKRDLHADFITYPYCY